MESLTFNDVDQFAEHMHGLGWQGRLAQTQPGSFQVDMTMVQSPGVISTRTRHSVANLREIDTPVNARTFGLVVPEKDGNSWCQHSFDEVILQMMPRSDFTAANPAGHLGFHLAYSDDKVALACEQHDVAVPLTPDACLIELTDHRRERVLKGLDTLFCSSNQLASAQISDELLSIFVQSFGAAPAAGPRLRGRARQAAFARAREYMRANIDEAITLADVARYACASRRTLTNAFQESCGLGPMAYLKLLRLNRVRQTLVGAEQPAALRIVDVANDHGFWHMGQFAADYRRLFDELPSDTQQSASCTGSAQQSRTPAEG